VALGRKLKSPMGIVESAPRPSTEAERAGVKWGVGRTSE
jgi:hypothetical protein